MCNVRNGHVILVIVNVLNLFIHLQFFNSFINVKLLKKKLFISILKVNYLN